MNIFHVRQKSQMWAKIKNKEGKKLTVYIPSTVKPDKNQN